MTGQQSVKNKRCFCISVHIYLTFNLFTFTGAANQLHPSYVPGSEYKSPETVYVRGYESYVENVPFCNYQSTVSKAGDVFTVISPYSHRQAEDIFPADTPPIPSNNAESFGDALSAAVHMSSAISQYSHHINEIAFFPNSPQIQLSNAGSFRDSLEDSVPNKINNFDLDSNPNDSATISGLSIDSNTERNLLNYIDELNDGKRPDESPPSHYNLRDSAVEIPADNSLYELKNVFLDSNSSELDTNMSRLSIDSISEYVATSILVDSYNGNVDQGMSF